MPPAARPDPDPLSEAQRRALAELMRISPVADDLGRRFAAAGHDLYLVGGSVRDALLGRLGDDLDFTTDAHPEQVKALAKGWADSLWETGIAFGTVGLSKDGFRLEVTTYRSESYRAESRKPAVTYGTSLTDDLVRRDFTVNAMAVSVPVHRFVDPYGGLPDLALGVLRTPGLPEDSFGDDPLRMLRAARFAAQLGFTVDPVVVAAMTAMSGRLAIVTAERVQGELSKLVLSAAPRRGLELLVETGLAALVLPELPALAMQEDPEHHHKDVYQHTLAVLENAMALERTGPDLVLRLAALLHDIGKPKTRRFEAAGGVSFHHHEVVGAKMARERLGLLKYSRDITDAVCKLVELHLRFYGYGRGEWTDSAVRRYVRDAGPVLDRLHLLVRSDCTTRNKRKAAAQSAAYDELEARIAVLAEEEELGRIRPDLDGTAIMALLGLTPGPLVGRAYNAMMELRLERGPLPRADAETALFAWAAAEGITPPG
ncbi:CCA tRNA nucleotidyltransferase [Acidothermaceae bacterium B102]|nr:CCA tRNA nucleotidyltransferase [Acidothermaceae bacterium B102]